MSTTANVRLMYEAYPYPSPQADSTITALADMLTAWFKNDDFSGKKILEAGCGSGHRLVAIADRYPKADVLGIDISTTSLQVGRELAKKHNITNVSFQQENLLELELEEKYDLIICTGVIHHTENPAKSLENICKHLSENGTAFIWVYHSFGEHNRLLERELLHRLWQIDLDNFDKGLELLNELSLDLDSQQYAGSELCPEGQKDKQAAAGVAKNVDAYLNPIVNSYRIEPALELFAKCHVDWVAVEGLSTVGAYKPINMKDVVTDSARDIFPILSNNKLLKSPKLLNIFQNLDSLEKLAVMELILRPTGIGFVTGRGNSYKNYPERVEGNIIEPRIISSRAKSNYMISPNVIRSKNTYSTNL